MKKFIYAFAAMCLLTLTACNDDGNGGGIDPYTFTYKFDLSAVDYTDQGYFNQIYNTQVGNLAWTPNLITTHKATEDVYDGIVYKSWSGFCPSSSKDREDHSADDWVKYQWGAITGSGVSDDSYLLACWDVAETTTAVPQTVTCGIGTYNGYNCKPQSVYITNSAYGYWAMKKGTAFSRPFSDTDWCKVTIIGLTGAASNVTETGRIEVYLARDGQILDTWIPIDLTPLGACNVFYFQMSSSDSGQFGMNNPAYFCLDDLQIYYM